MTVSTSAEDRERSDNSGPDRYGLVLTLLVVSFLLAAFLPGERAQALRSAQFLRLGFRGLMATLLVVSAVAGIRLIFVPNRIVHGMVSLWVAAVLALAIVAVVRRVLVHRVVNLQTIFAALSAYLLIGFLYAALFAAVRGSAYSSCSLPDCSPNAPPRRHRNQPERPASQRA